MPRFVIITLIGLVAYPIMNYSDAKMKTSTTVIEGGKRREGTRYVYYRRGAMRRRDSIDSGGTPSIVTIANCDTGSGYLVDLKTHEYRTYKVVKFLSDAQVAEYLKQNPNRGVPVEGRTVDTGERRVFFGYSAKHLITTIRLPRSKDNRNVGDGDEETVDGWYIDHERPDNNCAPDFTATQLSYLLPTGLVTYPNVPQFDYAGPLPTGLAVRLLHTIKFAGTKGNGPDKAFATEETVEDLADSAVQPSVFELPAGFRENSQLLRK